MAGFLAPIMMCAFPWITELPIPALQTDGVAKRVAINLAGELLRQNKAQLESGGGKDILSILVKDQKKSKHDERLSHTTLLENVSLEFPSQFPRPESDIRSRHSCMFFLCIFYI